MNNSIRGNSPNTFLSTAQPAQAKMSKTEVKNPRILGKLDPDTMERVTESRPELLKDGLLTKAEAEKMLESGDGESLLARDLLQQFANAGPNSAMTGGKTVYSSSVKSTGQDKIERQVTDNLEPVSGKHTDPRGARYSLKDVALTESTFSNKGVKEMGDGGEQMTSSFRVDKGLTQADNLKPTGDKVRFQGTGSTPEEAILNGLSSTIQSHSVESETTLTNNDPKAKVFEPNVLDNAGASKDAFVGSPTNKAAYSQNAEGTNKSRNAITQDIIAQGNYPAGTGGKLANGERVAFTPGQAGGKDTQAGKDFARLARDTGVAPGAQDLEGARTALNGGALKGDPITQDKHRIGAEYTTGLQNAVVSRFNNIAEVAHDASQVVRPDGQVDRQRMAAFRDKYKDSPVAQEVFNKAGLGGAGDYKGTIEQMGQIQQSARGLLGDMGDALNPEDNAFAAHPNLQALRGRIDDISHQRVIIQPVAQEDLAQHLVKDTSHRAEVGGSELFSSIKARVVESRDADGKVFYTAVGQAERGSI